MIRSLFLCASILVFSLFSAGCKSSVKKSDASSTARNVPFEIRPYETQKLPNGLTILWIQDNSLPYVAFQMMIKTGSSQDPAGKEGVAGFTADLLDKGTAKRKATQISEDLEQIGSGFDVEVTPDYMVATASSLSFSRESLLNQFREILLQPTFPKEEMERQRKKLLAGIQKMADRPEAFSDYLLTGFLYGRHPYGHSAMGVPKSVKSLKVDDLKAFYKTHFNPANAVLAVIGQMDETWKQKVVQAFEGWEKRPAYASELPEFPNWKGVELLLVDRSDLNQAQIQIGFKGVPRNIPEYMQMRAALKVLGESFGSRLFDEIRVKRGLTYGIRSWFDPRAKSGPMGIYTFTRVEKVGETVEETLNTYRKFVKDGVTDEEVSVVKALMRGQFPRTFETPEGLARQLLILNRYEVPVTYLTEFYKNLDKMDKASVNATVQKYFDPENLRILVYAPRKGAEDSLKKMGRLEVKNYKEFLQ